MYIWYIYRQCIDIKTRLFIISTDYISLSISLLNALWVILRLVVATIRGNKVYKDKEERPVLALLSELYSKLNIILVDANSTLLVCLILSTNYLCYLLLL